MKHEFATDFFPWLNTNRSMQLLFSGDLPVDFLKLHDELHFVIDMILMIKFLYFFTFPKTSMLSAYEQNNKINKLFPIAFH